MKTVKRKSNRLFISLMAIGMVLIIAFSTVLNVLALTVLDGLATSFLGTISASVSGGTGAEFYSSDFENAHELNEYAIELGADIAEEEGYPDIAKSLRFAGTVENCHRLMLEQIYTKLKGGKLYSSPKAVKWKCSNCGFEHTSKKAWDICPSCDMGQGYVEVQIDMNSGD